MTPHLYRIPVEGLTVPTDWHVGPVSLRPAGAVLEELAAGSSTGQVEGRFAEAVNERNVGTIGQVEAQERDVAIDLVTQALDVLRVFQHVRHYTSKLTQFGLAGEISRGIVPYAVTSDQGSGLGYLRRGEALGWTFTDSDEWPAADNFRWAADGIGVTDDDEGRRRALIGIQLLSDALIDQRSALKMVLLVTALEAWLLPRRSRGQTYRLARAVAFFGCGRIDDDLCGRGRDTCPYLALNPEERSDRKKLKRLRDDGTSPPWLCSEWHRVIDWYEIRSDMVHGAEPTVTLREANNALFWVTRHLTQPVLEWLKTHPHEPIQALDESIAALPPAPDWEARLGPLS